MAVPERILFRIFAKPPGSIVETWRATARPLREIGREFGKS